MGGARWRNRQPQILGVLFPKPLGDSSALILRFFPPGSFITGLVQLPMMAAAKRHGELITDFEAQGSRLCEPQVMRIRRLPAADKTGWFDNFAEDSPAASQARARVATEGGSFRLSPLSACYD